MGCRHRCGGVHGSARPSRARDVPVALGPFGDRGAFGTDFPDRPDNPAAAYFRLLRGDPELSLPAARTPDRLLPLDKYRPLRHLLMLGVALGIDAETYPEIRTALEGEPAMTPFAENFNRAVAAAREAAAETARERARAEDAAAKADEALARIDEAAAETAREKARADDALARERELVLDVVALRFDPEVARRVRPVLEAMDEPDGIYDVRSRALASASAEELLHGLGLSNGRSP